MSDKSASELEYTFDNPNHPHARWGSIIPSPRPGIVRLAYIGTGFPSEVRKCREKLPHPRRQHLIKSNSES